MTKPERVDNDNKTDRIFVHLCARQNELSPSIFSYLLFLPNLPHPAHLEPVTNGTLSSSSSTADLSQPGNQLVPCPPSFKIKLKEDTEILAGCTVHFELLVKGYPVPTLSFYKNQHPLQVNNNNGRIKVIYHRPDFCEFRIEKVRPEDSAVYEVLAINDLGSATTTGVLRVTSKCDNRICLFVTESLSDCVRQICSNSTESNLNRFKTRTNEREIILRTDHPSKPLRLPLMTHQLTERDKEHHHLHLHHPNSLPLVCVSTETLVDYNPFDSRLTFDNRLHSVNHKVLFSGLQGGRSRSSSRSSTPSLNLYRPGQPPLYIWFKDGVQFDVTDNRFQCHFNESDNTISLIFNQVNASDVGVYTCVAHTSRGKISCSAELKSEKSKAIFKRHLSDFEASDGDEDIDLIVKLDGSPKPLIRWLFEGKEIRESDGYKFITRRGSIMDKANQPSSDQTSSNTHILRINRASAEMNGVYTCEAFNSEGKSESSGRLTVNSKPKFLDHLRDTEVAIGTDITLSVKIVGYPFPDVTWYRNGHPIIPPSPGGTDDRVYIAKANPFHDNLHMLKIRNFGEDDEGEYSVEAVNLYGRVASSARIMVSERPVFKKILPPELNVQIGEEHVDLIVEFEPHPPISFVKWFVDDIEIIPLDRRYQILSDARKKVFKLRILRVNEGTAGSYMVIASNDSGSNYSSCEVKVVSPPEFMQGLEDRLARPGDAVTMDVVVSGNPAPRVRWYKDRRELTSGTEGVRIEMESDFVHILTIEKTNEATAEYECVITNEFGESRTKGTLTVIPEDEGKELEVGRFRIDVEEEHLPPLPQGLEEMEEDLEGDEEYEYVYESDEEGELEPIERRKMVVYVDATNPQKSTPFEQPNVQEQQIVREKPPLPTTPPRKKQHIGEMPTSTPESANLVNGGESRRDKELIVANREEEKKDDINSQQGNNLGTTHSSSPATKRDDESRTSAKAPESPPDPTPRRKRKSILEGGGRDSVISDFSSSGTFGQEETVGQEMTMTGKDEGEALILDTEPASIFEGIEVIRGPRDAFVEFRAVVCGSPMPQVKW